MGRFADLDIAISERVDRTAETPRAAEAACRAEWGLSCSRFLSPPGPGRMPPRDLRGIPPLAMPAFIAGPKAP